MSATESAEPMCPTFARIDWSMMISRIRLALTLPTLTSMQLLISLTFNTCYRPVAADSGKSTSLPAALAHSLDII
jgi:hypothetical protein